MKRCSGRADYVIGIDNTPTRKPHITRSPALSVGGLERVDAVAPRLLLGFSLSNGSKPKGAEQGAEQQSMATCVWVDAHRC
jgi:hypothetical protein